MGAKAIFLPESASGLIGILGYGGNLVNELIFKLLKSSVEPNPMIALHLSFGRAYSAPVWL